MELPEPGNRILKAQLKLTKFLVQPNLLSFKIIGNLLCEGKETFMVTASTTERGSVSEKYMVIDSDSHVVKTERTWQFMDPEDEKYRPVLAAHPTDPHTQWWIINGQARGLRFPTLTEEEMAERSKMLGRDQVTPLGARKGTTSSVACATWTVWVSTSR